MAFDAMNDLRFLSEQKKGRGRNYVPRHPSPAGMLSASVPTRSKTADYSEREDKAETSVDNS
jgi:hypothetical protein